MSDEQWHFYEGSTLHIYEIKTSGELVVHRLGRELEKGENFHCVISAGSWFGSRVEAPDKYALVGCTVSPGFDFADFELGDRALLNELFPDHALLIESLTGK